MALSSKALIIVPGACAPAALYDDTVARLIAKGFSPDLVKVVPTPSVGRPAPGSPAKEAPTMYDDANLVRKYAEELADAGHDILLIAHSYGGLPATEGIKGVSRKARAAEGKPGGVSRLFYTTAVVPKVGGTLGDIMGSGGPEFLIIEGDYLYNEVEASASRNYSDLPHDEGVEMAKKLDWHSVVTFSNPVTYPGYNDVPVSYLFCEDDQTVLPKMQQAGIDNIEESSGQKVDVIRLKAGHIPYASQPDKVVDIIAEVAQKS